jgi:hypothetical protein
MTGQFSAQVFLQGKIFVFSLPGPMKERKLI